jgi:hypothetical protein
VSGIERLGDSAAFRGTGATSTASHRRKRQIPTRAQFASPSSWPNLVEPAKVTALEKLDEGERAHRIASGWLRAKLDPPRAGNVGNSAPESPTL